MINFSRGNNAYLALAILVLLIAAGMRLLGAGHTPFWSDEAWNLWVVQSDFQTDVARLAANHHPPAYFWTLDAWRHIAGESKIALSFIAIAAGMLTCAIVIRAGKDSLGIFGALAAGLIFATFEQPVYYGQSIRHYSFLLLGAALTLWLLMRALYRPTWRRFMVYGLSVAFTAYSLYIGVFVVALQAFAGLVLWRGAWRDKLKLAAAYLLALTLFAPWLVIGIGGALSKIQRGAITGYLNSIPTTPAGLQSMLEIVLGGQAALGLGLIFLVMSRESQVLSKKLRAWVRGRYSWNEQDGQGSAVSLQQIRDISPAVFSGLGTRDSGLFLLCSVGVFLLMVVINLRLGIISERTLAMLAPAVALTLGAGLASLPSPARKWLLGGLVVWVMLTPQGILPRLNSDSIAQAVADGYSPGDLVILETGFDDAAFGYQLERTLPMTDLRVFRSYYEYDFPDDDSMMAALDVQIALSERVWLIYWNVPPRMAEKLSGLGYIRQSRVDVPIGSGDPLYVRDPIARVSLWARPPSDSEGVVFGDSLRLDGLTVSPSIPAGGESLHVDMWWTPLAPIDRDYTVGLFLLDSGGVTRAESFGPAPDNPMTRWPLNQPTVERHTFSLPPDFPVGEYTLLALVYWYETPDAPLRVKNAPSAVVGRVVFTE